LLNKSKAEVVVVETAFDSNDKVVKGDFYGNALQAAAFNGDEKVVELLVSKVADVNAPDGGVRQPLQ
jgi:hypothetical protein